MYDETYRSDSTENGKYRLVMFVIIGCIACLAITCPAVALLFYVVTKAKRQAATEGLFLLS